jgi:hypothetical protein
LGAAGGKLPDGIVIPSGRLNGVGPNQHGRQETDKTGNKGWHQTQKQIFHNSD